MRRRINKKINGGVAVEILISGKGSYWTPIGSVDCLDYFSINYEALPDNTIIRTVRKFVDKRFKPVIQYYGTVKNGKYVFVKDHKNKYK